jgi:hypothetical protein
MKFALSGSFSLKDLITFCTTVSKRTLQRDLAYLQKLKLIEGLGSIRNRKYRLMLKNHLRKILF